MGFQVGSASFDQNSGSMLLVGTDSSFNMKMIIFNTQDNTLQTGYVPPVSEIVCDNSQFAFNHYILSAGDQKKTSSILLYPNPAINWLRIKGAEEIQGDLVITITDANGKTVMQQCFLSQTTPALNIGSLPAGLYTVKAGDLYGTNRKNAKPFTQLLLKKQINDFGNIRVIEHPHSRSSTRCEPDSARNPGEERCSSAVP